MALKAPSTWASQSFRGAPQPRVSACLLASSARSPSPPSCLTSSASAVAVLPSPPPPCLLRSPSQIQRPTSPTTPSPGAFETAAEALEPPDSPSLSSSCYPTLFRLAVVPLPKPSSSCRLTDRCEASDGSDLLSCEASDGSDTQRELGFTFSFPVKQTFFAVLGSNTVRKSFVGCRLCLLVFTVLIATPEVIPVRYVVRVVADGVWLFGTCFWLKIAFSFGLQKTTMARQDLLQPN